MPRESKRTSRDELRPEYDLSQLKGGVRGKYFTRATTGTNLVLIEPDLARAFPDEASVNGALRLLLSAARAGTAGVRERSVPPNKRVQPTARGARRG